MRYEEEADALRVAVLKVVNELVVGARSSAWSRRALLPHLPRLLAFLGRRWGPWRGLFLRGVAGVCHAERLLAFLGWRWVPRLGLFYEEWRGAPCRVCRGEGGGLLGLRQGPACGSACRKEGQKGCHNAVALRRVCFFKKTIK